MSDNFWFESEWWSLALRPRLLRPSDNSSSVVSSRQFLSYFFRPHVILSLIMFVLNISSSVLKIVVPLFYFPDRISLSIVYNMSTRGACQQWHRSSSVLAWPGWRQKYQTGDAQKNIKMFTCGYRHWLTVIKSTNTRGDCWTTWRPAAIMSDCRSRILRLE